MSHYNQHSIASESQHHLKQDLSTYLRDDPSFTETLTLIDFFFDEDLIKEHDCNRLHNALDKIRCHNTAQPLGDNWRRIKRLSLMMPSLVDQSPVKIVTPHFQQRNVSGHQNLIVNSNNNMISTTTYNDLIQSGEQHCQAKKSHLSKPIKKLSKCFVLFAIFCLVAGGLSMFLIAHNVKDIRQSKLPNARQISGTIENSHKWINQSVAAMERLKSQVKILKNRLDCPDVARSKSTIPSYKFARWDMNAVTIAGGHDQGIDTKQLSLPYSLFVDENQTVYIADAGNHRIIAWKAGATTGEVLADDKSERLDQLENPTDVIVDRDTDSLLICDSLNEHVVRWPRHPSSLRQPEIVIDSIDCEGLFMDDQGSLYVTDWLKDEIRRYDKNGDKKGTVVAGGHGEGPNLNQFSVPTYLFVDAQSTLYVSDYGNHRVMKWMKGAKEGILVAGGNGEGEGLTQLSNPRGVWADGCEHVYVVDKSNHRVVRWEKGAKQGTVIVGGNGQGEQANQLDDPVGLSFDRHGHLYVADVGNHRVQRFSLVID